MRILFLLLVGGLAACQPPQTTLGGRTRIEVDEDQVSVHLYRDDALLMTFDGEAMAGGVVASLDDSRSYDPVHELGVAWYEVDALKVEENDGTTMSISLQANALDGNLTITTLDDDRIHLHLQFTDEHLQTAAHRLNPKVDPTEGFYGLGEVFERPEHRGGVRAMQLEVDLSMENANNEVHVPVPYLVGTTGWGWFVADPHPALYEVATIEDDRVAATFGTGFDSERGIEFYLWTADHPLDLTHHYYRTTGMPTLPAPWAYGPLIWRDENDNQAQVINDINTLRDLDLATTGMWIDRPYASGVNSFDFSPQQFPDAQAMIDYAHDMGLRMALWHTPYVDSDDPATAALLDEATTNGYHPPQTGLRINNWGTLLDLTNPDAVAWWQDHIQLYIDMGIEGFKLDFGEDVVPGIGGLRNRWLFANGEDERTMHSQFQRYYHRTYAELMPPDGGFLLCRGGTYGDQVDARIIWPGDLDASMDVHRLDLGNGRFAVGGLPAAISAAMGLGPSGFPFFASDTGGYNNSPPDKETFSRWFQHTALSAAMQIGTSSNDVAWEFNGQNGFDQAMLDNYRDYTRLHLRLFPYVWSYAQQLASDGRAIVRPLGLAYPDLGVHPPDTYLLGDFLLVAPVVVYGDRTRTLDLPTGTWFDWHTGTSHQGPSSLTVDAPLDTLPLFISAGAIVPLLRPTIDTLNATTDPVRVDSLATDAGRLWLRVAPGSSTQFTLYDGTRIQQSTSNHTQIDIAQGGIFSSGYRIELMAQAQPGQVLIDGAVAGEVATENDLIDSSWTWSTNHGGLVIIEVPQGNHVIRVEP